MKDLLGEALCLRDRRVAADLGVVGGLAALRADRVGQGQRAAAGADHEAEVALEAVVLALNHAAVVGGVDRLHVPLELGGLVHLARLGQVDADLLEHLLVAADRLVLHLHVGVEGDEGAVVQARHRVDLGERHVEVALKLGEAGEDHRRAVELGAGHAAAGNGLLGLEVEDGVEVREVPAADVVGVLLGDLLDVDPAHVGEEHHRALRAAVPEHGRVVLLRDVRLGIDQDADRHVAADLELEDLRCVLGGLVGRGGELHAARLHPPAGQHLRLDHRLAADPLGGRAGLVGRRAEAVVGDRNAGPLDDPARFVLVEAHGRCGEPIGDARPESRCVRAGPGSWRTRPLSQRWGSPSRSP